MKFGSSHPNVKLFKNVFLCILFFALSFLTILPFSLSMKSIDADSMTYRQYLFCGATDGTFSNMVGLSDEQYATLCGGTITITCNDEPLDGNVVSKPYQKKIMCADSIMFSVSFAPKANYSFAGVYYMENEYEANLGDGRLVHTDGAQPFVFQASQSTTGVYVVYFEKTINPSRQYHNSFETANDNILYDFDVIASELAQTNYTHSSNVQNPTFDISVQINANLDFRIDMIRQTTVIGSIESTEFVYNGTEYVKTFSNNLFYNNFSEKNRVTYRLVIYPKSYSIHVFWNGEFYYNPTSTEIKSDLDTVFSGYYKTRVSQNFERKRLDNNDALVGFNTMPDGSGEDYAFETIGTLFVEDKTIYAMYDRSNIIDIQFKVEDDNARNYVKHISKRTDELLTTADYPTAEEIFDGIENIAVNGVGVSISYTYSYRDSDFDDLSSSLSLDLPTTKNTNLMVVLIKITKSLWDNQIHTEPALSGANTVLISSATDLLWFAKQVNSGNTFEGKTISLTNDISLANHYWTPIGIASFDGLLSTSMDVVRPQILYHLFPEIYQTSHVFSTSSEGLSSSVSALPFKGVFEGNGYTISNMTTTSNTLSQNSANPTVSIRSGGLFGFCDGAIIRNLTVSNSSINGFAIAGAIVGTAKNTLFANVSTNTSINTSFIGRNVIGYLSLGGVCGLAYNCQFANTSSTSALIVDDFDDKNLVFSAIGGLLGYSFSTTIERSSFSGSMQLDVSNANIQKNNFFGGVAGMALAGGIENCFNTATITIDGENQFGGISGDGGQIVNCFSMPTLSTQMVYLDFYSAFDNNVVGFTQNSYSDSVMNTDNSYFETSLSLLNAENCFGLPKTSAELATQSTFEGWDFTNVWDMGASHPILKAWTHSGLKPATMPNWRSSAGVAPLVGDGSSESPYEISSVENLLWIDDQIESGNDFAGEYLSQTANIDLAGKEWTPIGSNQFVVQEKIENVWIAIQKNQYGFAGIYDGGDFEIQNLTMNSLVNNLGGLFGKTRNASVSNLIMRNTNIIASESKYSDAFDICSLPSFYVGAVVGYSEASDFANCQTFDSKLSACGLMEQSNQMLLSSLAQQVGVKDFVQMTFAKYYKINFSCVGGIVGYASDNSNMEVCYFTKSTNVQECVINAFSAGGIVGFCDGDISLKSSGTASAMAEGDAPFIRGSLAGGVVGASLNSDALLYLFLGNIDISNFVFLETVFAKTITYSYCENYADVYGRFFAGGIVGLSDATISESFNAGEIYGELGIVGVDVLPSYIANVGVQVGGIAGWAKNVYDSYNLSNIYAIGDGRLVYEFSSAVSAGICAKADKLYNCYNDGIINVGSTAVLNYNSKDKMSIASGIVGLATPKVEVINCLNFERVESEDSISASFIGRLMTSDFLKNVKTNVDFSGVAVISKSYYNSTKNVTSIGYVQNDINTDTNLYAFTDETRFYGEADYLQSSYWDGRKSWDFDNVWTNQTNGFPVLQQYKYAIYIDTDFVHEDFSYSGQGFYTPGQVVTIKAELPIGYYAQWVLPNGEVYIGSQITKTLIHELSGTYTLNVLEKTAQSYIHVRAHYSSDAEDYRDYYADQYGIRPNLIMDYNAETDSFVYVSESNILEVGYQRENYMLVQFVDENGEAVDGFTNFVIMDNDHDDYVHVYAVWEPDELNVSVEVVNGVASGGTTINKRYSVDENVFVETQGNINCSFDGWYLKTTQMVEGEPTVVLDKIEAETGAELSAPLSQVYLMFENEDIDISILQLYLVFCDFEDRGIIVSKTLSNVSLVANYVSATVTLTLTSSNTSLGAVVATGDDVINLGDGRFSITIQYGSMYQLFAEPVGENYFLFWTNNQTSERLYIKDGANTFRLTQDTTFTANFAPRKAQILFGATSGLKLNNGSYGTTVVEAGSNSTTYTFEALAGYYIHDVKIDGVSVGVITTYTFTDITGDHEITVVAKRLATLTVTVTAESSTIPVVLRIVIDDDTYVFPLRNNQSLTFVNITQNMVVSYYISIPTRYGYLATVNDSANYEGKFSTQQSQTLEVSIFIMDNNYLTE